MYSAFLTRTISIVSLALFQGVPSFASTDSSFDLRDVPVPLRAEGTPSALDYHHVRVDCTGVMGTEPLVDSVHSGLAGESYYARTDGFNSPYYRSITGAKRIIYCRRSVVDKLKLANHYLDPYGVEIFLWDGWRGIPVQTALWNYFIEVGKRKLKTNDADALRQYAGKFCSDPTRFDKGNDTTWPTHVTGGAVDLTLRRKGSGEQLFMGGTFDDASDVSFTDFFERKTDSGAELTASESDAQRNRRLLYWAMTKAGFANYPYEWWHYDFGTQMSVLNSGPKTGAMAVYGPAAPVAEKD